MAKNLKSPTRSSSPQVNKGKAPDPHKKGPSSVKISKGAPPKAAASGSLKGSPPPKKNLAVSGRAPTKMSKGSATPPARVVSQSRQTVETYLNTPLADGSGLKAGKEKRKEPIDITVPYGDLPEVGVTMTPGFWGPGPIIERKDPSGVPRLYFGGWEFRLDPKTSSGQDIEDALGEAEFLNPAWFATWAATGSHLMFNYEIYADEKRQELKTAPSDFMEPYRSLASPDLFYVTRPNFSRGLSDADRIQINRDVQRRYGGRPEDWGVKPRGGR